MPETQQLLYFRHFCYFFCHFLKESADFTL